MAAISLILIVWKISNYWPPKDWVSGFPSVDRNGISVSAIMEKLKNGCHFFNIDRTEKCPITDPPKFGSPVFQVLTEMEYQHQPLWKKLKTGCHFFNIDRMEKFPITDPPKDWVSGFPNVNGKRISASAIMKKFKNGCHFFNIDRTENF